ncbi:MAG: hypothetical protein SFV15_25895 [Polyangiaceae bacterium]|nr:hypothetical protein [Polyangiaceae bacterium]
MAPGPTTAKTHLTLLGAFLGVGSLLISKAARADPAPGPAHYDVKFEAGHLELEPETGRLLLSQGFAVRVARYRLVGDSVSLENSSGGVLVDGKGRLAFCACPSPPLTLGFTAATVAPPGDLLMRNAVLRVGPVPVFWTPYLWLRSPERFGILPPELAYRAEEGLLVSTGFHAPLATAEGDAQNSFDLRAGPYLRGGGVGKLRLATQNTSTYLEADYQQRWAYSADVRGVQEIQSDALAWDADWRGGARARQSAVRLLDAATRFDHARAQVSTVGPLGGVGFGPVLVEARGEAVSTLLAGAATTFWMQKDVAPFARFQTLGELTEFQGARESSLAFAHSGTSLEADGHVEGLGVHAEVAHDLSYFGESGAGLLVNQPGVALRLLVPSVRSWENTADPIVHFVEPNLLVAASHSIRAGSVGAGAFQQFEQPVGLDGSTFVAATGLRNALGRWGARRSAELSLASGWVSARGKPTLAHLGRAQIDMGAVTGSSSLALSSQSTTMLGSVAVGGAGQPRLFVRLASNYGNSPELAGNLEVWNKAEQSALGWLQSRGDSLGGELNLPFSRAMAVSVGSDWDAREARMLAMTSTAAYRHPCGCLALTGGAGARSGRHGLDAWVNVDLFP